MSTATLEDKLNAVRKKVDPVTGFPKAKSLDDPSADLHKILVYGHSGSGKTHFILGPLLNGERVFVVSTDFGSNGLNTIKNYLRKVKRLELMKNLMFIDLMDYKHIMAFLDDPVGMVPELEAFDPTVLVWEGFSSFNIDILNEYILSKAPGAEKAGELRHEGFTWTQQDWQGIKVGTLRAFRRFLACSVNGHGLNKILTCLESSPEVNDLTQQTQRTVLVHGTGRSLMGPGFDLVLETFTEEKKNDLHKVIGVDYFYRCAGESSKFLVKSRGYDIKPVEEADPEKIWRIIKGEKDG